MLRLPQSLYSILRKCWLARNLYSTLLIDLSIYVSSYLPIHLSPDLAKVLRLPRNLHDLAKMLHLPRNLYLTLHGHKMQRLPRNLHLRLPKCCACHATCTSETVCGAVPNIPTPWRSRMLNRGTLRVLRMSNSTFRITEVF